MQSPVLCAYCGTERAVNRDHVVPQSLARKYRRPHAGQCPCKRCAVLRPSPPEELLATVGACFACNNLKGARRLVPPSWADKLDQLSEWFPGTPWRVWCGSTTEPAFREVHV